MSGSAYPRGGNPISMNYGSGGGTASFGEGHGHGHPAGYMPPPIYNPPASMYSNPTASHFQAYDYNNRSTNYGLPVCLWMLNRHSPPTTPALANMKTKRPSGGGGHFEQLAGMGLGLGNLLAERLLSYPCVVLRRQCQVNSTTTSLHLTPFTLLPVMFKMQQNQGPMCLWKGVTSSIMVQGMQYGIETIGSDFFLLPREIHSNSPLSSVARHFVLKSSCTLMTTPFIISAFVESVQSSLASEQPSAIEFMRRGWSRCVSDLIGARGDTSRRLPIWSLMPVTLGHSLAHYVLTSCTRYTIHQAVRQHVLRKPPRSRTVFDNFYPDLFASFASSLAADAILYPFETVLHRLYLQGTRTIIDNLDTGAEVMPVSFRYTGLWNCITGIARDEGWAAFYKGFGALCLQYLLHFAVLRLVRTVVEAVEHTLEERAQTRAPQVPPPTASPPTHAIVSDDSRYDQNIHIPYNRGMGGTAGLTD